MNLRSKLGFKTADRTAGGELGNALGRPKETEYLSPADQRQRQILMLQRLLSHAASTVPYYKHVFEQHNFDPRSLRTINDLEQLPILTREIVIERREALCSLRYDKSLLRERKSLGISGNRIPVLWTLSRHERAYAYLLRHMEWSGLRPGMLVASMWRKPLFKSYKPRGFFERLRVAGSREIEEFRLPPFGFSDTALASFAQGLSNLQPKFLIGNTQALCALADYFEKSSLKPIRPRGIAVGGERVFKEDREKLREAFRAPVYLHYGAAEFGTIASECSHGGLHVNENLIVEVLGNGANNSGRIIVTDLTNFSEPLIRYDLGDVVTRSEKQCECGRSLALLDDVIGRVSETFKTQSGETVNGALFDEMLRGPAIEKYHVHQTDYTAFKIKVVPATEAWEQRLSDAEAQIKSVFGPQTEVNIAAVENIVRSPGDSYRWLQSDVIGFEQPT